jgi:hypothetical protein
MCTFFSDLRIGKEDLLGKKDSSQTIYLMDMYSCRSKLFA